MERIILNDEYSIPIWEVSINKILVQQHELETHKQ